MTRAKSDRLQATLASYMPPQDFELSDLPDTNRREVKSARGKHGAIASTDTIAAPSDLASNCSARDFARFPRPPHLLLSTRAFTVKRLLSVPIVVARVITQGVKNFATDEFLDATPR